jgi:hypothetical protein
MIKKPNHSNEQDKSQNPLITVKEGSDYFDMYRKYNETLRTWFVAFGLGGLYLLLTNNTLNVALKRDGYNWWVELSFMTGVISQVLVALVNKFLNWIIYYSTIAKDFHKRNLYKIADKFSELIWFDLIFDCITVVCFLIVFGLMFNSFG